MLILAWFDDFDSAPSFPVMCHVKAGASVGLVPNRKEQHLRSVWKYSPAF